jgi:hypothetical protein
MLKHGNTQCYLITLSQNLCTYIYIQCYGSGFVCFWASRIRIRLYEVRIRLRTRILLSSSKNSKKNLDSYDLLSLKNAVNVASKSNKQKKKEFSMEVGAEAGESWRYV